MKKIWITIWILLMVVECVVAEDMVLIDSGQFDMGDHHGDGGSDELPVHAVLLDSFFISKFEITNQQYCDCLNVAYPAQIKVVAGVVYASSDTSNSYPYCDTHSHDADSQIDYNDVSGTFSVRTKGVRDMSDDPMVEVSWYGAVAYCNWRSQQEGKEACYNLSTWECDFSKHGYRLPTEAEWEYAARGGENSPYYRFPWGDTISHSQANYNSSSSYAYDISPTRGFHPTYNDGIYPYTAPVGSFSPNGYGLYDVAGNVWEWCNDWYGSTYYSTSPYDNPQGPASGTYRVLLGGGWYYNVSYCRVASRYSFGPDNRDFNRGFRVVQVPEPTTVPVAHWKFDEGSGTTAYDSAGDNDGTIYGAQWTSGIIGGALMFDGVDDYVSVPDDSSLDFASGENFSVAAWFRIEAGETSGEPILQKYSNSNQSGYALFGNSGFVPGRIAFVTWGTGEIAALDDGGYNDGSWHYAVGVRSQSSGEIQLYIDGVEVDSNNEPSRSLANSANLHIGTNFTGHSNLYGKIDDVRVYDRALSAEEVQQLYLAGAGPISHWKFDEGEGDIAYDSAGDNDGTLVGDPVWTSGIIGGALDFDGDGDYVDLGRPASLAFGSSTDFTVGFWIKGGTVNNGKASLGYFWDGTGREFQLGYFTDDKIRYWIKDSAGATGSFNSNTIILDNKWHHVVAVSDRDGDGTLYVDGSYDNSVSISSIGNITSTTNNWAIGRLGGSSSFDFNGTIDDVRVYDRALSAEEILELYLPPLAVAVDIKPESCPNPLNVTSKGVLPVTILGTEDFDVDSIDAVSILLAGVDPIRSAYEDVAEPVPDGNECECAEEDPDGYTDLTLKFKTPEIVEALVNIYGDLIEGEVLALPLTGVLTDGIPIEGADCVHIVGKVPRSLAAKKSDVNEDGIVNILDFSTMAEYWLESAETCY